MPEPTVFHVGCRDLSELKEKPVGIIEGLPWHLPTPKIPKGCTRGIYRGKGWRSAGVVVKFAFLSNTELGWRYCYTEAMGAEDLHYVEFLP